MSNDPFYSFERVLRELQMEEEELKRLVSEGEIRAYRDADNQTMKFRREEVDRFRNMSGDTQDTLGDEDLPEELVFDEDDADQEVGMATAAIDDAFLEEDDEPLELEEAPPATSTKRSARARPSASAGAARKPRVVVDEPEEAETPAWASLLALVTVLLLFAGFVVSDAVKTVQGPISQGVSDWVDDTFLDGNPEKKTQDEGEGTE